MIELKNEKTYRHIGKHHISLSLPQQMICLRTYLKSGCLKSRDKLIYANYKLIGKQVMYFVNNWSIKEDRVEDIFNSAILSAIKCLDRYVLNVGTTTVPSWINTCVYNDLLHLMKTQYGDNGDLSPIKTSTSYKDRIITNKKIKNHLLKKMATPIINKTYLINGKSMTYRKINEIKSEFIEDFDSISLTCDIESSTNEKSLINMLSKILNEREFMIFYDSTLNLNVQTNLKYKIKHENDQELRKAIKRGTNKILIGGVEKDIIVYENYEGDEELVSSTKHYQLKLKNPQEVIYLKRVNRKYEQIKINPLYNEKEGIYIYNLLLDNKGYVMSDVSIGTIYYRTREKIRSYLIKNNIKNISDYESNY